MKKNALYICIILFSCLFSITAFAANLNPPIEDYAPDKNPNEDCEEQCGSCTEGTEISNACVSFIQAFGRSPKIAGAPVGKMRIYQQTADILSSGANALYFDHPLMRRIVDKDEARNMVTIEDSKGWLVTYRDGKPIAWNTGADLAIRKTDDGVYVEQLANRTLIYYNPNTNLADYIITPDGVRLDRTNWEMDVIRDGVALAQVWSKADGLMNIERLTPSSFKLSWYAPSVVSNIKQNGRYTITGAPSKTFTFEYWKENGIHKYSIYEYRSEKFNFTYLWESTDGRDWTFIKDPEGIALTDSVSTTRNNGIHHQIKTLSDSTGRTFKQTKTYESSISGAHLIATGSIDEQGIETTQWSSTRMPTGNVAKRIASSTNQFGGSSTNTFDTFGRILSTTTDAPDGLTQVEAYTYINDLIDGFIDRRPRSIISSRNGVVISSVAYSFDEEQADGTLLDTTTRHDPISGRSLTTSIYKYPLNSANTIERGRTKLIINENQSATHYTYTPTQDDGYIITQTQGYYENGEFKLLPKQSTQRKSIVDFHGNVIREEAFVHTGTEFVLSSWENKTYNLTHTQTGFTNNTGDTESSEWICTGPIWQNLADGTSITNTYDKAKRLISSTHYTPFGAITTSYTLDPSGKRLSTTISTNGVTARTSSNTYDFRGRTTRSIDEQGRVTRYSYSIDNKTTSITTPSGAINFQVRNIDGSISYNCGSHKPYEIIHYGVDSANGLNWTETYTAATSTNTPILVSKVYENALGEVVRREQVTPNGAFIAEVFTYNNKGQTTSRIIQANTVEAPTVWTTVRPVESYTYDKMGSRISTTLVASSGVSRSTTVETEFFQNDDGAVWKKNTQTMSSSDASIAPITSSFETKLYPLSQTDYAYTISYDERGNAIHKTQSFNRELSQTTTVTYYPTSSTPEVQISALGAILKTISSTSVTNTFTYNALRERLSSTDGRGNTSSVALDQYGRVTHITDASGATSQFIYDNLGRVITTIDALGNQTHTAYDALDRIVAVWGATYTKINAYDIYGRQVALATTRDNSFSLSRNAIPDITQAVAGLDITRWTFDEATGVVLKKIYPDNTETQYSYNSLGQVSERTRARGVSATYAYDEFGSMLSKTYSDNTPQVSYTYDALGRCTSGIVDGVSTNTFTYNQFGDPISESQNGTTVSRTYDNLGRPIGYSLAGDSAYGSLVSYAYDDFGRFSTVSVGTNQFTYSYLQGTPLIASIDSNFGFSRATSYENNRDLISSVNNTFNDATISRYDYTNDALGRRTSRNDTIGASQKQNTFGYNVRNEVVSATLGTNEYTYSYDPIGNRTSFTLNDYITQYESNPLNQYIAIQQEQQTAAPTYDADGNMLSSPSGWSFTWNAENRLVSASRGGAVVHYTYDAFGRMISKQIIGVENKTITYTWDMFNIIKETDNSNATYNIWGLDIDGTMKGAGGVGGLLAVAKSGGFYTPTYDANGNITEYVDVGGNIVAQYKYSAFGEIISQSGEPFTHRFSTKPYCPTTGLIEYQSRKYEPILGRWLSRDPIEEAGGLNLYAFCGNNGAFYFDCCGYEIRGHHIIPRAVWISIFGEENLHIWKKYLNSQGEMVFSKDHNFTGHGEYNRRVKREIEEYLRNNRINKNCIDKKIAADIFKHIKSSVDPYIKGFNYAVKKQATQKEFVKHWYETEGKNILKFEEEALCLTQKKFVTKFGQKNSKKYFSRVKYIVKKTDILLVVFFVYDTTVYGADTASQNVVNQILFVEEGEFVYKTLYDYTENIVEQNNLSLKKRMCINGVSLEELGF